MSFDKTNAAHLLALKVEFNTDPMLMGYATTNGSTNKILDLFNDPEENKGLETTGDDLTISLFLDAAANNPGDLTVSGQFTQGELETIKLIIEASASLDDSIERYRTQITNMFANNAGIRTALEAQSRRISRGEVLFGLGTNITRDDWIAARES